MPPDELSPLLVSRDDAARLLACCPRTIDTMIRNGRLPAVRIGRAVRLTYDSLTEFVEREKKAGVGAPAKERTVANVSL